MAFGQSIKSKPGFKPFNNEYFTLEALTLNPSPKMDEGLKISLAPLLPLWEKGLGGKGLICQNIMHPFLTSFLQGINPYF
jgi:hypothetical protein